MPKDSVSGSGVSNPVAGHGEFMSPDTHPKRVERGTYRSPNSSLAKNIKLSRASELVGLVFKLQPIENATLFPQYITGLHGWFLDQVRQLDPKLSQVLHDEQDEKAFTLSPLDGLADTAGQRLQLYAQQTYHWTVTAISKPLVDWIIDWLKVLPPTINLRQVTFKILSVEVVHPPTTYRQLFQLADAKTITLSFLSPTSFRRKGHHFPLPLPFNVFHSYLRRWNAFSNNPFNPDPFLAWVDENVLILRHQLHSVKVAGGKKGAVTGFLGAVEYGLTPQAATHPGYIQLLFSLARLAPYCGTGHKTTFGLGQTRLGWLNGTQVAAVPSLTILLGQRIEQLTEQLMQVQKRTGGERATQVCQTRATILARREFGESLSEIAQDLEMPYETIKSYAKVARKLLKTAN